ncbi:MAG: MOSC domain-containing protein [Solirubrobacteraceae bacterium]|nr:MOSC domain-containing protein [Solirubrobacteraceae bacterium]
MSSPEVVSVNVGTPKQIGVRKSRPVMSSIDKREAPGPHRVEGVNVAGDEQADLRVHGGPDKAVYAYASEDTAWWAGQLGRDLWPGAFGENLTTAGMDCTNAIIGERWRIGSVLFEVCQPRQPCFKLGLHLEDPKLLKRFAQASRPGAYLRILEPGTLQAGDGIKVLHVPDHGVTIRLVADAVLLDHGLAALAAQAPELPDGLRAWLADRAE